MGDLTTVNTMTVTPARAFAVVNGVPLTEMPHDLFIPPQALEVFLDSFEGPLDLLLYLIRRQNLDILNIPIAVVTRQYLDYIGLMKDLRLELAAEYMLMAATLAEIKSRLLLPRHVEEMDEEDPRAELVRRLQEYERFKEAAERLDEMPRVDRDIFLASALLADRKIEKKYPNISLDDLVAALHGVLRRAEMYSHHRIQLEPLSVRERMSMILSRISAARFCEFSMLFEISEGRPGVIVTLLAVLELLKESLVELVQNEAFGPIHVRVFQGSHETGSS